MLPQALADNFQSENYARMIVHLDTPVESASAFAAVDDVRSIAYGYYGDQYFLVGTSSAILDIKDVIEDDFTLIKQKHMAALFGSFQADKLGTGSILTGGNE
jgi:hypothetical protein